MTDRTLMSADDIRRASVRIAHEIVEETRGAGNLVLVGIQTRGVPLAQRIAAAISNFESVPVPVGSLDISLHRDDLARRGVRPRLHRSELSASVTDMSVVLVDDVLYTGRTIRAALDALNDYGRPRRILLAVLVDRGHRELPIRADFVGKNIPTRAEEQVHVLLTETDGRDEVLVHLQEKI